MSAHRQGGVAVVLAMAVVALAAVAATAIMVAQSAWARQSKLELDHKQAQLLVLAGVDWARAVLGEDSRTSSIDHLEEPWALRLAPLPVDNGRLEGFIEDQQGRFNLNNLVKDGKVNPDQLARLRRLLSQLDLPVGLADKLADWLDADDESLPQGAEDGYYLALQPAYLSANRPLLDLAELARVAGFDAGTRERLRPFVTVLPGFTAINVNTAPAEVLAVAIAGLDIDGARALVAKRERAYFRDSADFQSRLPVGVTVANEGIAVSSDYFVASVRVVIGEAEAHGEALLTRHGNAWPASIWLKSS